jgi:uncharacterized membrane protein YdbT with pleckstrin-like domain
MAFPKSLLADHEKLIFDLRPHWVSLVPPALWTVVLLIGSIAAAKWVYDSDGEYQWWEIAITIAFLGAWYVLAVLPFLRWRFTMFVLTSDRLITRQGIIAKHSKEIPLERINDVAFSQSVLERFLGAGDLMLESAGERGQTRIGNVRKPEQVQLMVYKEAESNNARLVHGQVESALGGRNDDAMSQLERLAKLKEAGAISDAEYEAKKAEFLKRL